MSLSYALNPGNFTQLFWKKLVRVYSIFTFSLISTFVAEKGLLVWIRHFNLTVGNIQKASYSESMLFQIWRAFYDWRWDKIYIRFCITVHF